jgi:hypothetical protein
LRSEHKRPRKGMPGYDADFKSRARLAYVIARIAVVP